MDIHNLSSLIPAEITILSMIKFLAILALGASVLGLVFRLCFGKGSSLNRAVSACMGILCVYIMTAVIYTLRPAGLEAYLVPLPFLKFSGEYLFILPIAETPFPEICTEVLSLIILAFLYNLCDWILPEGKKPLSWFVFRFLTVALAIAAHYILTAVTESFLPDLLVNYGPVILIILLFASLLTGFLGLVLGLILSVANPLLGILCGFFFSNKLGKQISKAILTTALLCALVAVLGHFEYQVISISITALVSYIPVLVALLALWYLIGCKL